ncbi:carbohydrate ABC transporter permease [Ktedonospora formicarum]|uniref:Sugar ABC transporter permease n=1 Tax=Ktedonospora formicarum TaxID=2778364 RepID=A0A8J3HT20_9CHLR|nr:sugar ABC transporter permease [Ktedonospora formicarum]GHO42741.1 sugar ABC transporter permease [Ktedonospora formicarum]
MSSSVPTQEHGSITKYTARTPQEAHDWYHTFRRNLSGYLFLLPALLVFAIFVWYPIILGFIMSFQSIDLINPSLWVGLANYRHVFSDPLFAIAWRNTLVFSIYALLSGYAVPIILALLINEMRHARGFFRLIFYIPVMLPPIVTVFLWRWIYNPDDGLLNALLNLLHVASGSWLETPATALPALVVVATWSAAGSTILIYLAALQGVPASLYEAAEIDGANLWQRLWHITLPSIRPIMLLMLILQIINTMQVFIEPFTMTNGGPQNSTMSILLLIYNYAFQQADFGGASAIGVILFLALAAFTLLYMRLTSKSMQGE